MISSDDSVSLKEPNVLQGKPPSNAEIQGVLGSANAALEHEKNTNQQLDQTGQNLAEGAGKILRTTQDLLQDKNKDEKIQKFLQRAMEFGKKFKDEAQFQAQQKVGQIDQQAVEEAKQEVKKTAEETLQRIKSIGNQLRRFFRELITSSEFRALLIETIDVFDKLFSKFTEKTKGLKEDAKKLVEEGTSNKSDEQKKEDVKEQAKETVEKVKDAAEETKQEFSEEDKDQLSQTLRAFLSKVGSQQQYKRFSQEVLSLLDFLKEKKEEYEDAAQKELKEFRDELYSFYEEGAAIIGEFAGKKEEDWKAFQKRFVEFYQQLSEDKEINRYFHDLKKYAQRLIDNPKTVDEKEVIETSKRFINEGADLFKGKARDNLREIFDESKSVLDSLQNDKYAVQYKEGFEQVQKAFTGTSMLQALSQTRLLAVPILKELLSEIPLPKIVGRNSDSSWTIDNLNIKGREITADDIKFKFRFGLKEMMQLAITIKNIEGVVRNAHFTYYSVGIFTDYDDEGTFSARLVSPKWKIKWIIDQNNAEKVPKLRIATVEGGIDKLDIKIEHSKHQVLDNVALALFSGDIKRNTSENAENSLRKYAEQITEKFNEYFLQKKFYSRRPSSTNTTQNPQPAPVGVHV